MKSMSVSPEVFGGFASAKPVPFVSTPKKAGGAGPQRGSKGEEVTPVPGGGGAGAEVRKEPGCPTITRRAKSTNTSTSVLTLCVFYPPNVCVHSLWWAPHFVSSSQPFTSPPASMRRGRKKTSHLVWLQVLSSAVLPQNHVFSLENTENVFGWRWLCLGQCDLPQHGYC